MQTLVRNKRKDTLEKVISKAKEDKDFQQFVDYCLNKCDYPAGGIKGKIFRHKDNMPPAFTLGLRLPVLNFLQLPSRIGAIFISDKLPVLLSSRELEYVVLHELGHVEYNHIIANVSVSFGKQIFTTFLQDYFSIPKSEAENLLGLGKWVLRSIFGLLGVEETITKNQELKADKHAIRTMGEKDSAVSALLKLSEGKTSLPSRVVRDGEFEFEVMTVKERIKQISEI